MRHTCVYISANLVPAVSATEALASRGYMSLCMVDWPGIDDEAELSPVLFACDVILRIGPENAVVRRAPGLGIPVYWSLDSLCASEPVER